MTSQSEWVDLVALDALIPGHVTEIVRQETHYAVYDTPQGITVSYAACPHAGANLCHGYFDNGRIECPLHQALFDACTGDVLSLPAVRGLQMIESRVANGSVQILTNVKP